MKIFENFGRKDASISELIPIVSYDDELQTFVMKNETVKYLDILQIKTEDLINKSIYEKDYLNMQWAKFYKTCAADIKIISLNFPTDTSEQQRYIQYKIENCKNPVFKEFLEIKLSELKTIERNRSDREYYLMIFAEDSEQLFDVRQIINSSLGAQNLCYSLEKEKKKKIFYRFNNPNTALFSQIYDEEGDK